MPTGRRRVTFRLRSRRNQASDSFDSDSYDSDNMKVVLPETRYSESAVPSVTPDPDFVLPKKTALHGARNSLYSRYSTGTTIGTSSTTGSSAAATPLDHHNVRSFGTGGWRDSAGSDMFDMNYRRSSDISGYCECFGQDDDGVSDVFSSSSTSEPYAGIVIEITNHSFDPQGAVMYHVDIKGPEGMLSAYTIRKRFTQFKRLHHELSKLFEEFHTIQKYQSSSRWYSDSHPRSPGKPSPAGSTGNNIKSGTTNSFVSSSYCQQPGSNSSTKLSPEILKSTLPPLPGAGVWSYLRRHDSHLVERRKKRFEDILRLAIVHPASKYSQVLGDFLSNAPSHISQHGSSYVSLKDYSVPAMDHHRESLERKLLKKKKLSSRRLRSQSDGATRISADVLLNADLITSLVEEEFYAVSTTANAAAAAATTATTTSTDADTDAKPHLKAIAEAKETKPASIATPPISRINVKVSLVNSNSNSVPKWSAPNSETSTAIAAAS